MFDLCAIITIESQRKSKSKVIQQHFDKTKRLYKNPICPYKSENVKNNIGQPIRKAVTEKVRMTDMIADMILDMFDDDNSTIQIQRNDLASQLGCVPSQINYVITSRFTPEQGYRIESRRGGGGCIYITRADNKNSAIVALINSIGESIDERSAKANIYNLNYQNLIDDKTAKLLVAATADGNLRGLPAEVRNAIRAKQFKQMLLAYID